MPLTHEDLIARQDYIGGSDVPAILGLSPYQTRTDIFLAKAGLVEPEPPKPSLEAEIGNRLEPAMVEWTRDRIDPNLSLERDRRFHEGIYAVQVDGWLPDLNEIIEVKTSGLNNPTWWDEEWGPDGTDQVPLHVRAQVVTQLMVTGASRAHVAAFLGAGLGPRWYTIHRSEAEIREVHAECSRFWRDFVLTGTRPDEPASLEVLVRHVREPGKIVEVPEWLLEAYTSARSAKGRAESDMEEAKRGLLEVMGDAEVGVCELGRVEFKADKNGNRRLNVREVKSE